MTFQNTPCGFKWGAAAIERLMRDDKAGWIVVELTTQKATIEICVTRTGHIRLSSRGTCVTFKHSEAARTVKEK